MRNQLTAIFCITAFALTAGAATIHNDATCDIAQLPAATLLLPYFEVDLESPPGAGETTIFTITNVTNLPEIAHVTLWTDLAYPVIDVNVYLTGYDVQSINLYDLLKRGWIAPPEGTGPNVSPVGVWSGTWPTGAFDNPNANESTCVYLPVELPGQYIARMQQAFTTGNAGPAGRLNSCQKIGNAHRNAVGYATIDVVSMCSTTMPIDEAYFTKEILFDNVLTGDYVQFNGTNEIAQGGPLVHIRAIPEGGTPGSRRGVPEWKVDLPRTFYIRYQRASHPRFDARQPLPALFAARYISGREQQTFLKIWREGREADTDCKSYVQNHMNVRDMVRFDEEENPETIAPDVLVCTPVSFAPRLPVVSMLDAGEDDNLPSLTAGDSGWLYLNLDYCNRDDFAGQNWVISSMRAGNGFSVDIPATPLGNGCSAPVGLSEAAGGQVPIGPAPNVRP